MSNSKFVNISRLITAYNLQIDNEVLPDNLKCVKCKLVLQDACAVPCGCRFCRVCIDDLMASGSEFCPGVSEDCGESLLSDLAPDYIANKSVCKLTVKCPQNGCCHKCQLDELEEHMRVCGRKSVACSFHELGCQEDKLAAEKMSEHFQEENHTHYDILIGMIAGINREMGSHKREIEMLKRSDENNKMEIEKLKSCDLDNKNEIDMLKSELVLKDGEIRSILDQMVHVENEIKSIKREKADLVDRMRIMSEKIEREIDERRESDERDIANVLEYVDRKITANTALIESNKTEMDTVRQSDRDYIRSINQDSIKSMKGDINWIKSQLQSIQVLPALGLIDARCEWTIDGDVGKTNWDLRELVRTSAYFTGATQLYKYRLASWNNITRGELQIYLCIHPGQSDSLLSWPFTGTVAITVADKRNRKASQTITQQCYIRRPPDNSHSHSEIFRFVHYSLIEASLNLSRGVRVSSAIVPYQV